MRWPWSRSEPAEPTESAEQVSRPAAQAPPVDRPTAAWAALPGLQPTLEPQDLTMTPAAFPTSLAAWRSSAVTAGIQRQVGTMTRHLGPETWPDRTDGPRPGGAAPAMPMAAQRKPVAHTSVQRYFAAFTDGGADSVPVSRPPDSQPRLTSAGVAGFPVVELTAEPLPADLDPSTDAEVVGEATPADGRSDAPLAAAAAADGRDEAAEEIAPESASSERSPAPAQSSGEGAVLALPSVPPSAQRTAPALPDLPPRAPAQRAAPALPNVPPPAVQRALAPDSPNQLSVAARLPPPDRSRDDANRVVADAGRPRFGLGAPLSSAPDRPASPPAVGPVAAVPSSDALSPEPAPTGEIPPRVAQRATREHSDHAGSVQIHPPVQAGADGATTVDIPQPGGTPMPPEPATPSAHVDQPADREPGQTLDELPAPVDISLNTTDLPVVQTATAWPSHSESLKRAPTIAHTRHAASGSDGDGVPQLHPPGSAPRSSDEDRLPNTPTDDVPAEQTMGRNGDGAHVLPTSDLAVVPAPTTGPEALDLPLLQRTAYEFAPDSPDAVAAPEEPPGTAAAPAGSSGAAAAPAESPGAATDAGFASPGTPTDPPAEHRHEASDWQRSELPVPAVFQRAGQGEDPDSVPRSTESLELATAPAEVPIKASSAPLPQGSRQARPAIDHGVAKVVSLQRLVDQDGAVSGRDQVGAGRVGPSIGPGALRGSMISTEGHLPPGVVQTARSMPAFQPATPTSTFQSATPPDTFHSATPTSTVHSATPASHRPLDSTLAVRPQPARPAAAIELSLGRPSPTVQTALAMSEPPGASAAAAPNGEDAIPADSAFSATPETLTAQRAEVAEEATVTTNHLGAASMNPAPAAAGGAESPSQVDELARKLFDPLMLRLRAELLVDRERRGLRTDAW